MLSVLPLPFKRHLHHSTSTPKRAAGFTIIEIMVVVVIIAILAAIVVPKFMAAPDKAKIVKVKEDIRGLQEALDMYNLDNGFYPTTEQGLQALVNKPSSAPEPQSWHQYYPQLPVDPWNQPYHYVYPGTHGTPYDIFSYGANNKGDGTGINATMGNWNLNQIST